MKLKNIPKYIRHPLEFFYKQARRGRMNWMPDRLYLKLMFRRFMGYSLNLENPQTLNEKLQWLKLYNRRDQLTRLVDKYGVREFVAKTVGEEYLVPVLGVWESFDEIDFGKLPDQFVLKCTHDSGGLVICKDKSKLDLDAARKKIEKSLKSNYYKLWREWPYKNVPPRIIAEQFLEVSEEEGLPDYKLSCFDGHVDCIMVCVDRHLNDVKFFFFDKDWNFIRRNHYDDKVPDGFTLPRPEHLEEMIAAAEKLSKGMPYVRVDFYSVKGKVYFGEMTFFPDSGFDLDISRKSDEYWGAMLNLPAEKIK